MCANTCPNEHYIMEALRRETPEKIPSFCQSIMNKVASAYFERYDDEITDDDILLTQVGDLTVYKAFGYSSRWNGSPNPHLVVDDAIRDKIEEMTKNLRPDEREKYSINSMGSVRGANDITGWFVRAGIETPDDLRFFLDHWDFKEPTAKSIEQYKIGRQQCMDADFVPFASAHVVVEPANQSISFALTARLMRKDPELLDEFYDFLVRQSEARFKAAIRAGYKCFCTADDMAYKNGPMFNPKLYRRFVTPCAKRLCDLVHEAGGVIFMHTDGFIDPVMDCFIEAGYDAIQPLEPTSGMTIERVKRKWGDRLACIGNVDTTYTLSFGTEDEVRKYVHRCFREARGDSKSISGYIFAASGTLHNRVKLDNALAMMDEYKKVRDGIVPI